MEIVHVTTIRRISCRKRLVSLLPLTIYLNLVAVGHSFVATPHFPNHTRGGAPGKLFSRPVDDSLLFHPFCTHRSYGGSYSSVQRPSNCSAMLNCTAREGFYNPPALLTFTPFLARCRSPRFRYHFWPPL